MAESDMTRECNTGETILQRSNLIKARENKRFNPEELAEKIGVHARTYKSWEDGTRTPRRRNLRDLRDILEYVGTDRDLLQIFEVPVSDEQDSVNESQIALEPLEEPQDTQGTTKDSTTLKENRRQAVEQILIAAGIGWCPGSVTLSSPIQGPRDYLDQCEMALDASWMYLNAGELGKVERTVNAHVRTLTGHATTKSEHQKRAAKMGVQLKVLQMILATRNHDYKAREEFGTEAVEFGYISGNPFALSTAIDWHGNTYIYLFRKPQVAIALFNDALKGLPTDAMLNRSSLYSQLSIAYALDKSTGKANATKAQKYADMARNAMPPNPESDPLYQVIRFSESELDQFEGRMNLCLVESFPNADYGKLAYDLFDVSLGKQAIWEGQRGKTLIRKGDACIATKKMGEFESCIREGLAIAIRTSDLDGMGHIGDVVSRIPRRWQNETAIKTLVGDIAEAQTKLITPTV